MRYLRTECHLSENTVAAYGRDMKRLFKWLGNRRLGQLKVSELARYPAWLAEQQLAPKSVVRHVASLKVFFRYLQLEGVLAENEAELLGSPKLWQRVPQVMSPPQVDELLGAPRRSDGLVAARSGAVGTAVRHWMPRLGAFEPGDARPAPCRALLHLPRQGRQAADRAAGAASRRSGGALSARGARQARRAPDADAGVVAPLDARRSAATGADLGTAQALRSPRRGLAGGEPSLAAA